MSLSARPPVVWHQARQPASGGCWLAVLLGLVDLCVLRDEDGTLFIRVSGGAGHVHLNNCPELISRVRASLPYAQKRAEEMGLELIARQLERQLGADGVAEFFAARTRECDAARAQADAAPVAHAAEPLRHLPEGSHGDR